MPSPLRSLLRSYDRFVVSRARDAYTSVSGWRSKAGGFEGMVEEMRWGLGNLSDDTREAADNRVLETIFFGRACLAALARFHRRFPLVARTAMARASPFALHWLVGEIELGTGATNFLPRCEFRRAGGEELCERVCRRPTETFCRTRGFPVTLRPRRGSLGCDWRWGDRREDTP